MVSSTLEEILTEIGAPTCVGSWQEDEIVPDEPFIEYHRQDADDISGDDKVAAKRDVWLLSLYGKQDDMFTFWERLEAVEDVLDARELSYARSGDIFFDDCVYSVFTLTLPR